MILFRSWEEAITKLTKVLTQESAIVPLTVEIKLKLCECYLKVSSTALLSWQFSAAFISAVLYANFGPLFPFVSSKELKTSSWFSHLQIQSLSYMHSHIISYHSSWMIGSMKPCRLATKLCRVYGVVIPVLPTVLLSSLTFINNLAKCKQVLTDCRL